MTTVTFRTNIKLKKSVFDDLPDFYAYLREYADAPLLAQVSARTLSLKAKSALKKARTLSRSRFVNV